MAGDSKIVKISNECALRLLHEAVFERLGAKELKRKFSEKDGIKKTVICYKNGDLEILRDSNVISLQAKTSDDEQIVLFKLRDRRFDGTKNYETPLTEWPYNTEADKVLVPSLEISRYSRDPNLYWQESDLVNFLREPFDYMFDDPKKFENLWNRAFTTGHFPGQSALPLRGAARFFKEKAVELGYELDFRITASPSHLYVAQSDAKHGFFYQSELQKKEIELIEDKLNEFKLNPKIKKQQSSWITLLQKFPSLEESELFKFHLGGLEYPLFYDGENAENVWMVYGGLEDFEDFIPKECEKRVNNYERS